MSRMLYIQWGLRATGKLLSNLILRKQEAACTEYFPEKIFWIYLIVE